MMKSITLVISFALLSFAVHAERGAYSQKISDDETAKSVRPLDECIRAVAAKNPGLPPDDNRWVLALQECRGGNPPLAASESLKQAIVKHLQTVKTAYDESGCTCYALNTKGIGGRYMLVVGVNATSCFAQRGFCLGR